MANIGLILAGGSGQRMGQNVPKQFISVNGKEVMVYTLQKFQNHPLIDNIAVVCISGFESHIEEYITKYGLSKLKYIIPGGNTGQESVKNGLFFLEEKFDKDDLVIIHDSVRPLVSEEIITDCISKAKKYGIAMAAIPCPDAMFVTKDGLMTTEEYPRDQLRRTQRPHCFRLEEACKIHREAVKENIQNATCTTAIATKLGYKVALSLGSENNLKLTTMEDIRNFEALIKVLA